MQKLGTSLIVREICSLFILLKNTLKLIIATQLLIEFNSESVLKYVSKLWGGKRVFTESSQQVLKHIARRGELRFHMCET